MPAPASIASCAPVREDVLVAMGPIRYRGRRAATIENDNLRVTVLEEGGHIVEIVDKATGVNPLWSPPWPSIEPSDYSQLNPDSIYGGGSDARLLAGIMGHSLCLDIFGPPTDNEAMAGIGAHGEGSVAPYELTASGADLVARAHFPIAGLEFERRLLLRNRTLDIRETLVNRSDRERQIGWTQHVTLGPPFLERGTTQFRASATRSKVFESTFGAHDYLTAAAEFAWPMAPSLDGGVCDLRVCADAAHSSAYTAHLMNRSETAFFVAFSPRFELALAYVWKAADFPWMGMWEENHSRLSTPWNGRTLARGMEFGVSPMPETRDAMVQRGSLFGVPTFRQIAPAESIAVEYYASLQPATVIPESMDSHVR
jgi:hypothetical protein